MREPVFQCVPTCVKDDIEYPEVFCHDVPLCDLPFVVADPNFKSYAEQVWEGLSTTTPEAPPPTEGKPNPNLPHSVTEEEFEFYEALRAQDRRKKLARQREEDAMRDEFHKAREASLKLSVSSAVSSGGEQRSTESDGSSLASSGKPSPFAVLGTQKQRSRPNGHLEGDGCIFDVTTKAFQEKQRKRAVDARRQFNLIVKKPKTEEHASGGVSTEGADSAAVETKKNTPSDGSSPREEKPRKETGGTSDASEADVFASLCEAYGDSDDSG